MSVPVAVGIDVGGTKLVAAAVAADGAVVERRRVQTPAADEASLLEVLVGLAEELGHGLPIGIGIAGLVTPEGVVRYGPNIGVRDLPLAQRVATATGSPVAVLNDASAAALGEQRAGAGRGLDHVVLVTLGTGVGGGVVVDGRLLLGQGGLAGELGHLVVEADGRPCPCGSRGCVEAYASGTAIGLLARERLEDPSVASSLREVPEPTGKAVSEAAAAGDPLAAAVLAEAGRWLGVALAGLTNALDPQRLLLGGGAAAAAAPWLLPAARSVLATQVVGHAWRELPEIHLTELGDDAGMIGAALHVLDLDHATRPAAADAGGGTTGHAPREVDA